jgi:hypothetical protein
MSIGAYSGDDGPATLAELNSPLSVYVDSLGKLYIADYGNHVIRLVQDDQNNKNQLITTIAGSLTSRYYNGDNLPANLATVDPVDVKGDSLGNIYFTDCGNNRIRTIDAMTGIISTSLSNEMIAASINHPVSQLLTTFFILLKKVERSFDHSLLINNQSYIRRVYCIMINRMLIVNRFR